ncbi:hypothetical protein ACJW31_06G040500 [Castanea mollissima]
MAKSAVKLVIHNLAPLFVQEARLLEGIHGEVKSIHAELEEKAYHIEDVIDEYILQFAKHPQARRQYFRFLTNIFQFATKLKTETWASLFIEEVEVTGIEYHRDKLINWLVEGPSSHILISVVGISGVGKTTLVKKVHDNEKVVEYFDCSAWVTMSQSYNMFCKARKELSPKEIDKMEKTKLINESRQYLLEWRFWGKIKIALPTNEKGSRIVMTSQSISVAPSNKESSSYHVYKLPPLPLENAWILFCKVFQCEGGYCPPKCEELPLAIVTIGGLFSTKEMLVSYILICFPRITLSIGSVKEKKGITLKEIAQDYLNQLIQRSLVQVALRCRVHDMMCEVIISRSEELNFYLKIARHLSIQNNVNAPLESITNSHTCSILILGVDEVPNSFLTTCFANFKYMRSMDCEGVPIDYIPKEVGNLFHLKYLSLRDTNVQMLPKSIAYIENYDLEFNIDFKQAVTIPSGIGHLESLPKLHKVEANRNRKLNISKLKRDGMVLCLALEKMSYLQSLRISSTSEEEVLELQSMFSPPSLLQTLTLGGRLEKLPKWIPKLKYVVRIVLLWSRLIDDSLKVLQALPNLLRLWLYEGYEGEELHFEEGSFKKLKFLRLSSLGGLNRLIIDEGALPFLEKFWIGPSLYLKDVPIGIHHLKSLKTLDFLDMPR